MLGFPSFRIRAALVAARMPFAAMAALALLFWSPQAFDLFFYDRAAVAVGEIWRLLTGHLVHLGFQHFVWNAGTLLSMMLMAKHMLGIGYARQAGVLLLVGVAIAAVLWLRGPAVGAYSGLSGALNGLFVPMIYATWQQTRDRSTIVVALLSLSKIAYEATTGDTLFVDVSWPASAEAHATGLGAGIVFVLLEGKLRRVRRRGRVSCARVPSGTSCECGSTGG